MPPRSEIDRLVEAEEGIEEEPAVVKEVLAGVSATREAVSTSDEEGEALPSLDDTFVAPAASSESQVVEEKPRLRFAEDIISPAPTKSQTKSKKKRKKKDYQGGDREEEEDGAGSRKSRRAVDIPLDEDEEY